MGSAIDSRSNGDVCSRILLVDDQDSVLQSLYAILERDGHEVLAARSGAEALTTYRRSIRPIDLHYEDTSLSVVAMAYVSPASFTRAEAMSDTCSFRPSLAIRGISC